MQRYDLVTNYRCGSSIEEMEHADDGEWIRYEDVEAQLAAQEQRAQALLAFLRSLETVRIHDADGVLYSTCPACWCDQEARGWKHVVGCPLDALTSTPSQGDKEERGRDDAQANDGSLHR
jgi:hypothetical protein